MIYFLVFLATVISALISRHILHPGSLFYITDQPNERSLHVIPMPKGGGLGVFISLYLCVLLAIIFAGLSIGLEVISLLLGSFILAVTSYIDDRQDLSPKYRLVAHFSAAGIMVTGGLNIDHLQIVNGNGWSAFTLLTYLLSLICIVWSINLYNFMDGMDGFAAGMAVFGFSFFAFLGWVKGVESFVSISLLLSASSLGFLLYNFPPAKIFMGDVGSAPMGFMMVGLSFWGIKENVFQAWVPLLIFSPFLVDATATILVRLINKEKVWVAHRSHYYQKLVQLGWGHKKTVLAEYFLMTVLGITAVIMQYIDNAVITMLGIIFWTGMYLLFALRIHHMEKNKP